MQQATGSRDDDGDEDSDDDDDDDLPLAFFEATRRGAYCCRRGGVVSGLVGTHTELLKGRCGPLDGLLRQREEVVVVVVDFDVRGFDFCLRLRTAGVRGSIVPFDFVVLRNYTVI
jgi:hypothetical protein